MIGALISFELRRRLKMFSTYVYGAVLFLSGAFLMAAAAGLFKSISSGAGSERVHANSPHSVFGNQTVMALLGLFMIAAVFGQSASQDFTTGTWPLIFTRNVKRAPYLLGRFFGAFLFSAILFLAIPAGQFIAAAIASLIDPSNLGPQRIDAYLWPWLIGVLPMLLIAGAVFFSLAALTRQMAPVYVGVVVLVLGYLVLSTAMSDVQNHTIGALADPFGFLTVDVVTRYWTPAERNRELIPLFGIYAGNRAIWLAVAAAILSITVKRFRTTIDEQRGGSSKRTSGPSEQDDAKATITVPSVGVSASLTSWWLTAFRSGWLAFRDVLRSPVYWSFIAAGSLFVLIGVLIAKEIFGTATLPVTWQVLELAGGTFQLFSLITITFYAGELVWKERDAQLADILDAARVPTWVGFIGKLVALVLVVGSLQLVVGVAALTSQLSRGFFDIEWRLYASELILFGVLQDVLIAVLALIVQIVINQKYLAHGAMVLYYVSQIVLRAVGVEERLLRYASEPGIQYSDMNGYGHWIGAALLYRGYWFGIATLLTIIAFTLVARGRDTSLKQRFAQGRRRLTLPWKIVAVLAVISTSALGGYLFKKTHLDQKYRTSSDTELEQADFEKEWKSWGSKPTPRIVDADVRFDIFPNATPPQMKVSGTWTFENKTTETITEVLVTFDDSVKRDKLIVGGSDTPTKGSLDDGVAVFTLVKPLQPGEQQKLEFEFVFVSEPIKHGTRRQDVVGNGTFFNNFALPILGYLAEAELTDDGVRRKYGLEPKERMADRDDEKARQRNYIRGDSDFIGFRATVSTVPDQIGVAPGTLTKEWTEGDRRFFRYEMDQPILNFFSVLSARYTVVEDSWNDVKLQIFHDVKHPWNVPRMMQGMKDALTYCTSAFGPYQHHQARILEFPRYQTFAQSFPNTIPYSEGIGFIARVRDDSPEDLDYPYYVTAHEIAHQWWAHQVVGGNVQGATVTSETLAQYSALMVMKQRFGAAKMRRFLKFELDRYLIGRALERKKEVPLSRVENQPYIHYQKGSLAMFWLQDLVGEDTVNRALKKYVEHVKFKGPPYTNSTELISFLRAEIPEEHRGVIDDLFEFITLYDNRTTSAEAKKNASGTFDVTAKIKTVKYRSDDSGEQTELDFDDVMEIGGIDADGNALCVEKRRLKKGEQDLKFTCATLPARAGVDPLNKLVDRTSDDNTASVTSDE